MQECYVIVSLPHLKSMTHSLYKNSSFWGAPGGGAVSVYHLVWMKPSTAMVRAYIISKPRVNMKPRVRSQQTSQIIVGSYSSSLLGPCRPLADLGVSYVTLSPRSDTHHLNYNLLYQCSVACVKQILVFFFFSPQIAVSACRHS